MGEIRSAQKFSLESPKEINHSEDLSVDRSITLNDSKGRRDW